MTAGRFDSTSAAIYSMMYAVHPQSVCREHGCRLLAQVQSGQAEANRPAPDVVDQYRDALLVKRQLHGLDQEPPGFFRGQPQISLPQFRDVAACGNVASGKGGSWRAAMNIRKVRGGRNRSSVMRSWIA